MFNVQAFVNEYQEWSSQEKFKSFGFIDKLSEKWKYRFLNDIKFNFWAFLFGPLYYIYLGLFRGIFYTLLSVVLFCFGVPWGIFFYVVFSLILAFRANSNYLKKLKKIRITYLFFEPDADTPYFNISSARLITVSLLTGGFYLVYWGYRNLEAVRLAQKDDINPFLQSLFIGLTSVNIFRPIAYSAKLVNYTKKLRPMLSAWIFFFLFGSGGYNSRSNGEETEMEIPFELIVLAIVLSWIFITLLTLLVNRYQRAIQFYCAQKGYPPVKRFTMWEIILIVIGILSNLYLILLTAVVLGSFI